MDNSLHEIFIEEAEDNLQLLETLIINLEENPDDPDMINDAFRSIHSIKGGAGLAGFDKIKDFTHIVEDLFENIRCGELKIEEKLISIILSAMDIMKAMIENIKQGIDSNEGIDTTASVEMINSILNSVDDGKPNEEPDADISSIENNKFKITLSYFKEIFLTGLDPLMFINDLKEIGNVKDLIVSFENDFESIDFNPEQFYLTWSLTLETKKSIQDIRDIFCFVIDESNIVINPLEEAITAVDKENISPETTTDVTAETSLEAAQEATAVKPQGEEPVIFNRRKTDRMNSSYIRVPTDKLENIFNTVSELLITQARLTMLTEELEGTIPEEFTSVADSLKNQNKLLQDQVTSLRMMNLSNTFDRFKRVVRDMAADLGKKIKLELEGQETELDKNMIEKLNDPLKHLVRNCIDHGIETSEERIAAGKPEEGTLKLSAFLENGKVVIEVSDDGYGIDKNKLLQKAIDRGVTHENNNLTDNEILNLIFHPGLSTAEKITDISGRGVGMDVVKSSINELHGSVDVISKENKGTCFRLNLPLTLAILDGMLIGIGREKYIIPTLVILEIFRPEAGDLKTISGGKELVMFRENYIPVIRLHEVFNVDDPIKEPVDGQFIVVNSGGVKVALLVDSVLEQYQVVLKSLEKNFKKVANISSATILGDGDVALIIDIPGIVKDHQKLTNE